MTSTVLHPDVKVEIAFNSGYSTPVASRTWTDVSQWVEFEPGINITHGRQDEFASAEANRLTLTLDNSDGRFTPEKTSGAYYPNVKIGRPIRVTSTWNAVTYTRFIGYVDEWPVAWNGTSNYAEAQITASSRMARLGYDSTLGFDHHRGVPVDAGHTAVRVLADARGRWRVQRDRPHGRAVVDVRRLGCVPEFGTAMELPGDSTATGIHHLDTGSQDIRATLATPLSTANPNVVTLEAFVAPGILNSLELQGPIGALGIASYLRILSVGDVYAAQYYDGNIGGTFVLSTGSADASFAHHLAGSVELSGAGVATVKVYIDGVLADTTATGGMVATSLQRLVIGRDLASEGQTIAHVAINADMSRVADRADAGMTGFSDDTASERIVRYAGYANIDAAEVDAGTSTNVVGPIDTANDGVLEAMRRVEATENGVLFDSRSNFLTFNGRAERYHTSSSFTLDAATQQLESDIAPKLDRSNLANDVTAATSADGSSARAIDQTSIDEYGFARVTFDIAGNQDAGFQAATWRVLNYCQPLPRIDSLGVDLLPLNDTLRANLMNASVGTRITLSGLPTQASSTSVDFFIEGYTEAIGPESYEFTYNVSPVNDELNDVWILQDATYGVYDSNRLAY